MKKLTFIILAALLSFCFASCEKGVIAETDDNGQTGSKKQAKRLVELALDEESITLSEEPMAFAGKPTVRAGAPGKVYAVNVYEKKNGAKSYSKYAYGLFTDPSAIAIMLTEGNLYQFECLIVADNEDKVYNKDGEYLSPFLVGSKETPAKSDNKFVKSSSANFTGLTSGTTNISDKEKVMYPRVYKFYGTLDDFNPASSTSAHIKAKRVVFGLHLSVTPPTEGKLDISFLKREITVNSTDEKYDRMSVYSFNQIAKACEDGYGGNTVITVKWMRADGTVKKATKTITLKRNVTTTVNIEMKNPPATIIDLEEEDSTMTTETVDWLVDFD
ncbi:hypothetical protein [Prevotella sp. HUN102]|uniref:hypothetical protein n=1 Tax=Prevotella sp. HUN102 TaxID=1392486 RepID=UPI00048EED23|nr:hypothetical protein [Prevotella sp. HUN102]